MCIVGVTQVADGRCLDDLVGEALRSRFGRFVQGPYTNLFNEMDLPQSRLDRLMRRLRRNLLWFLHLKKHLPAID